MESRFLLTKYVVDCAPVPVPDSLEQQRTMRVSLNDKAMVYLAPLAEREFEIPIRSIND